MVLLRFSIHLSLSDMDVQLKHLVPPEYVTCHPGIVNVGVISVIIYCAINRQLTNHILYTWLPVDGTHALMNTSIYIPSGGQVKVV